jgi:hypothetical protein
MIAIAMALACARLILCVSLAILILNPLTLRQRIPGVNAGCALT